MYYFAILQLLGDEWKVQPSIQYFLENKDESDKIPDLVFLDLNMPYIDP
ncbi:hypothetical protein NAF19_20800 [Mucilaginibacter sp. RT5R15]|nr:hypothetical protein [Mucilaginibacter flavidus]